MDKQLLEDLANEIVMLRKGYDHVIAALNETELDALGRVAVLTKCLVELAVLVEERDQFHMRMAMTYDYVKSQQPESTEIH